MTAKSENGIQAKFYKSRNLLETQQIDLTYGQKHTTQDAESYLLEAGGDSAVIAALLATITGSSQDSELADFDLEQLSQPELVRILQPVLEPLQRLSTLSLDQLFEEGFAVHDATHIQSVLIRALGLANKLPKHQRSEQLVKRLTVAILAHDLGNIFSRKLHSLISVGLLEKIVPGVKKNRADWSVILRAIYLHDEPIAMELIKTLVTKAADSAEFYELVGQKFSPEALLLLIADKTDIWDGRISRKAQVSDVERDPHLVNNLLAEVELVDVVNQQFVWQLNVSTHKAEHHLTPATFLKADGQTKVVPKNFDLAYQTTGQSYLQSWEENFWKNNQDRVYLTAMAAFTLYPGITSFTLRLVDGDAERRQGQRVSTDLNFTPEMVYQYLTKKLSNSTAKS